jgi:hypothetical protein
MVTNGGACFLLAFFNVHNINYLEQFILPLTLEIALDFYGDLPS